MDGFFLLILAPVVGIPLFLAGIIVYGKTQQKKYFLIGLGLIALPFIVWLIKYAQSSYYENKLKGNYSLSARTENILTLSDNMTFELKQIDTIHRFGNGTWTIGENDNGIQLYLNFSKVTDHAIANDIFDIDTDGDKVILKEKYIDNKITLIKE